MTHVQADELADVDLVLDDEHARGRLRHKRPRVTVVSHIHHDFATRRPSNEIRTRGRSGRFTEDVMTRTVKRIGLGIGTASLAVVLAGAGYEHLSAQGPAPGGPAVGQSGGPGRAGGPMARRGGPGRMNAGPLGPMLGRLDLTSDQRARVRQFTESHRDEQRQLADRAMKAHEALQDAITGSFDESAIRARAADVAAIDADQAVAQARVYQEVVQVLTPEQQQKLKTLQTEMKDRRTKMQERRQNRGTRQQR
jgi:Spy/CpxP family protein refolding chaperone